MVWIAWIGENYVKKSLIIAFVLSLAGLYVAIELTEFAISMTVDGTAE